MIHTFFQQSLRKILLVPLFILLTAVEADTQTRQLNYQIFKGFEEVGSIHFTETTNNSDKRMKMESKVSGAILFVQYSGSAKEEAVYQDGVLCYSSIYRIMNGKEKVNKQHRAVNNQYVVRSGNKSEVINNYPITYNMLSLYTTEPVNIDRVYSDNFQCFVDFKKQDEHQYKISLPNGNTNYYYYKDGVLAMIRAISTWYTVTMVLKK